MKPLDLAREGIEDAAADWLVRRDAGMTPAEKAQFERWLAADPNHGRALAEAEAAFFAISRPRELGEAQTVINDLALWKRRKRRQHRRLALWATAGIAATLVFAFWLRKPSISESAPQDVVAVRPESQTLVDGSVVELNAGAEIQIHFSPARRDIRLVSGEVHFAVTKDPSRPFIVAAGGVNVRAVGTQFVVRLGAKQVDVIVTEGQVAIDRSALSPPLSEDEQTPIYVPAGIRVLVPFAGPIGFEFRNTPLAEAADILNRKNRVKIIADDPSLAGLKVSGIYWADDPVGFTRLLESSFDLKTVRESPDRLVLRRAP